MKKAIEDYLLRINYFQLAWTEPIAWIVIKDIDNFLDLGCGMGKWLRILKLRANIKKAVGVDIYKPYLKEAKTLGLYNNLINEDIKKISFKDKSFDVVLACQVLEHLNKKDAIKLIDKIEKIAKKQIIIAAPIGEIGHPKSDNQHQEHKSYIYPEDFEKRGYKVIKYGWKWLLGPNGLAINAKAPILRKVYYILNFFLIPIYYLWQSSCDFSFTAYKFVDRQKG